MTAFMLAGPHRGAMKRLLDWCDEASVVHWFQDVADLPSWEESHRRMREAGRPSKVNFPLWPSALLRCASTGPACGSSEASDRSKLTEMVKDALLVPITQVGWNLRSPAPKCLTSLRPTAAHAVLSA